MTRETARTTAAAIEQYRPEKYTDLEWSYTGPVVRAAVHAASPASTATARKSLGALASFLLWTPDWDRATAPDLSRLLTADAIDTATNDESWGAASTRDERVRALTKVAIALGSMELEAPSHGAVATDRQVGDTRRFPRNLVDAKQDDAEKVALAVAAYKPQHMAASEWHLAAESAQVLVMATQPATAKAGRQLMGAVAAFLTKTAAWDRRSAPDLAALLTLEAITTHVHPANFKSTKTRDKRRTQLLLLARATGSVPTPTSLPATSRAVDVVLAAAAVRPIPVTVLAGIKRARSSLPGQSLEHLAQCIARTQDEIHGDDLRVQVSSTLSLSTLATGLRLTTPHTSVTNEGEPMARDVSGSRSTPTRATSKKKVSRRAAGAAAMAAHQRVNDAGADRADGGARRLADAANVDPAIRTALDKFLPQKKHPERRESWRVNRELAIQLVCAYKPTSPRNATNVASYLAAYLAWAASENGRDIATPLSVEALLHADHIELFLDAFTWDKESKRSARSLLRRIGTNLRPHGSPTRFKAAPPGAPYSNRERHQFIRLAQHQPTPLQQRRLSFIVGLGLGAGIDSRDFRYLAAGHCERAVVDGRSMLLVHVPGRGARARTVAVADELAPMVLSALDAHYAAGETDADLLVASCPDAINIATPTTRRIRSADDTTYRVTTARLRNTWLVAAMCAPISMADLMQFAGIRSAGTLTGLLAHCPAPVDEHVSQALSELIALTGGDQ